MKTFLSWLNEDAKIVLSGKGDKIAKPCDELKDIQLKIASQYPDYTHFKMNTARKCWVLADGDRNEVITNIQTCCGGVHDFSQKDMGSLGAVAIEVKSKSGKPIILYVGQKPLNKQGNASAGVNNEMSCVNVVNEILKSANPIDVVFIDRKRNKFVCRQVVAVSHEGKNVVGGRKADVSLVSASGQAYSISLKMVNAEKWESLDRKAKETTPPYDVIGKTFNKLLAAKFDSKGKISKDADAKTILHYDPNTSETSFVEPYPSGVVWKADKKLATDVMFGSDCGDENGCIIVNNFMKKKNREFTISHKKMKDFPNGAAFIKVDWIIDSLSDVSNTKEEPYIMISNSKGRTSFTNYTGIRAQAVQKRRALGAKKKNLNLDTVKI